jgi:hypothetical protein
MVAMRGCETGRGWSGIGEYEINVRLAGSADALATVVVAV